MRGHNIHFHREIWILSLNYPQYPLLSGALQPWSGGKGLRASAPPVSYQISSATPNCGALLKKLLLAGYVKDRDGTI